MRSELESFGRAAYDLHKYVSQMREAMLETASELALLGALLDGSRYYSDAYGTLRRVPGKKPLLNNGKKSR